MHKDSLLYLLESIKDSQEILLELVNDSKEEDLNKWKGTGYFNAIRAVERRMDELINHPVLHALQASADKRLEETLRYNMTCPHCGKRRDKK